MDIQFEHIQPWNGKNDTGRDARLKLQRNFEKIAQALKEIGELNTDKFLRKDIEDVAQEIITFLQGIKIGENGSGITVLPDGTSQAVVDRLYVRIKAIFDEIDVKKATHVGGEQMLTPAGMKCVRVEELSDAYRCYFNAKQDGVEIVNEFTVGQLAIGKETNIKEGTSQNVATIFFWRYVTAVGPDYIDLSKTDCAKDSDAPKAGDDIVGLGHKTDITRQAAIVLSSVNEVSPSITFYQGINDYSLSGKEVISLGFDKATGHAFMRVYGEFYVGEKDQSSYIRFSPKKGVEIKGTFHIQPGSTGWRDLDGLPDEIKTAADAAAQASKDAAAAQKAADAAQKDADTAAGRLDEWAADGKISPTEKLTLKQELKQLEAEYTDKIAECQKYGVADTAAYTSAWNAYKAQLVAHSADTPENIPVSADFAKSQAAFYNARTALLAAIADAAKSFVDLSIAGIAMGAVNILRNSGFTGDYLSDELTASTELSADKQMYSEALKHWSGMATVANDTAAVSGKSVAIGSLSQPVKLITGEKYVISFKAKGTQVAVSCGNFNQSQALTSGYQKYVFKFTFGGTGVFVLSGTATICDVQLERGTIATEWSPSPLDNNQGISHMQAFEYLMSAIKEGSVDLLGGLVLANMIQLGNYKDGKMQQVTAGISGIYNDSDDVAFWAGGNFQQAINTVMKFKANPGYQPTDAEWAQLANFVATHGGDLFLRGYIYALGGLFRGRFETSYDGKRIVIDPETKTIELFTKENFPALKIGFESHGDGWDYGYVFANRYVNGKLAVAVNMLPERINLRNFLTGFNTTIEQEYADFRRDGNTSWLQVGLQSKPNSEFGARTFSRISSNAWPSESEVESGSVYIEWDQNDTGLTGKGTLKIKKDK